MELTIGIIIKIELRIVLSICLPEFCNDSSLSRLDIGNNPICVCTIAMIVSSWIIKLELYRSLASTIILILRATQYIVHIAVISDFLKFWKKIISSCYLQRPVDKNREERDENRGKCLTSRQIQGRRSLIQHGNRFLGVLPGRAKRQTTTVKAFHGCCIS